MTGAASRFTWWCRALATAVLATLLVAATCGPGVYRGYRTDGDAPREVTVTVTDGATSRRLSVATTEVTQREYREVTGESPSYHDGCDECPVEMVSWYDAAAYANALSERANLETCYRLDECTEAPEFDRRASLGTRRRHPVGARCAIAELRGPSCTGYRLPSAQEWEVFGRVDELQARRRVVSRYVVYGPDSSRVPRTVASRRPNAHGIYDSYGNVDEWVETASPAPVDVSGSFGAERVWFQTVGGCFGATLREVRSTVRIVAPAAWGRACLGFRVVRTLPDAPAP